MIYPRVLLSIDQEWAEQIIIVIAFINLIQGKQTGWNQKVDNRRKLLSH